MSSSYLFRVHMNAFPRGDSAGGLVSCLAPAFVAISCNMGARFVMLGEHIGASVADQCNMRAYALPFTAFTVA